MVSQLKKLTEYSSRKVKHWERSNTQSKHRLKKKTTIEVMMRMTQLNSTLGRRSKQWKKLKHNQEKTKSLRVRKCMMIMT